LVRVGLVATFARWKGHDVFIDAVADLAARRPVRAYIVGGPIYATAGSQWMLAELRERVEARGLADVIGFTGHVEDVPAAIRALDVVVHASTEPEPFGMAIVEAMACGRPVLAARAGGAAEIVDGTHALGYAPGDAAALASGLESLILDPPRRAELGTRARESACARFCPSRMAAEFREAYLG
jgi:glycosyltransferase involved in cell wall biosynthesis